jgi:hypothetical protein
MKTDPIDRRRGGSFGTLPAFSNMSYPFFGFIRLDATIPTEGREHSELMTTHQPPTARVNSLFAHGAWARAGYQCLPEGR